MTSGPTLLALDFDGTLAPICNEPSDARMNRGAVELLREASRMRGVTVAVMTGRDVEDLLSRIELPGAYVIGSHGLEVLAPGHVLVRSSPPLAMEIDPLLGEAIAARGLRLEKKKHALALHWRGVDGAETGVVADRFRAWAGNAGLDLIEGRCVVEARRPGNGKEEALRWLASAIGAGRVIYAGDDLTDFGALRFAVERGRGVFFANSERVSPPGVTVVSSFLELFRLIRREVLI